MQLNSQRLLEGAGAEEAGEGEKAWMAPGVKAAGEDCLCFWLHFGAQERLLYPHVLTSYADILSFGGWTLLFSVHQ